MPGLPCPILDWDSHLPQPSSGSSLVTTGLATPSPDSGCVTVVAGAWLCLEGVS